MPENRYIDIPETFDPKKFEGLKQNMKRVKADDELIKQSPLQENTLDLLIPIYESCGDEDMKEDLAHLIIKYSK